MSDLPPVGQSGSGRDEAALRGADGRTVGNYEIRSELGRGGAAIVYLARQVDLDRLVALKELSVSGTTPPDFARRFLRESRLAGSLSHPSIVTVHEYFEHDGVPYIVMEYLPRGSLRAYVGSLNTATLAGVLEGVLAGLVCAESSGIVHRDLKPENIMVTADGRVKLTDFGIAKATQEIGVEPFATVAGMTVGTPAYMAPEQALGEEVGPWTDLYSVGVMTWEQLVGHVPFSETVVPTAVLLRHVNEQIPAPISVRPDVDPALSRWVETLVANDPRERAQTATEAWDALEGIIVTRLGAMWRRGSRLREPDPPPVRDDGTAEPAHLIGTYPLVAAAGPESAYHTYIGDRPAAHAPVEPKPEPRSSTAPPGVRRVHLALSPSTMSVRMGGRGECVALVTNGGSFADDYLISVTGPAARFSALETAGLRLEPGDGREVRLRFNPDEDAGEPGPVPFDVLVVSAGDASVSERVNGTVVLDPRTTRSDVPAPRSVRELDLQTREPWWRHIRAVPGRRWRAAGLAAVLVLVIAVAEPLVLPGGTVVTAPVSLNIDDAHGGFAERIPAGTKVRLDCLATSGPVRGQYREWRAWWHLWGGYQYYPAGVANVSLSAC
jgi:serine/threonine protein kinase